ncbi:SusC/RagA family TonB-linked outer membrane protein [Chondrinema litorale]|uniref:SusC/RagA family TonB-linked outer membrane protein n=1 Tax=Chondrinema litorale TaxID=2994555 RepID=UPI0025439EA5|nr:SusC/RagA family TonB-linked outer membrane protein [Chondrinema litorale]UZR96991.1 SusC/RagA family TonB-linked outer membrane protein [Chondrinema litorale]
MRRLLQSSLCVMLILVMHFAYAQDKVISGTVTSGVDQSPLPGVNVVVKGTSIGTITNVDGYFKVNAPETATTLVFTYIGFKTQEVEIGSQTEFSIGLEEDAKQLSEVVVTALGIEREERSLGYATQGIDAEPLSQTRETNIVNSLAGKVAGVQVTGSAGNFGGSSRIVIRGVNSITGNNNPLFVVDGTPIDNSNFNSTGTQNGGGGTDFGNAAQDINPDDIASMQVLKGPSAAALYGSRAANGVILITTKKGSQRKGLGVSFNMGMTANSVLILPDYQNEYGGGYKQEFDLYEGEPVVNYAADESWGPRMDGQMVRQWYSWYPDDPNYGQLTPFVAHPDNIKDFYETGYTQNYNLALDGGNESSSFRISMTHMNQKGHIPNSKMDRNTINFSGSHKLSDKFTASANVNYVRTDTHGRPSTGYGADQGNVVTSYNQWFQRQVDMEQLKNYKTPDGIDRTWNISSPTNLRPLYWENPYWVLYESPTEDYRERVFGNVSLSYDITPDLKVSGWARTDFYTDRREMKIAEGSIPQSKYSEDVRTLSENNYEFLAQYNKNLGESFSVAVNLGANSRREKYYRNYGATTDGLSVPGFYSLEASTGRPDITDYYSEKIVNSVYGSANLGYKDMLYLDMSLRNDWSSTLPSDNNSYLYPSATASFVFSELLGAQDILSFGKVRAGWAQVGNDTDPYRLENVYTSQNNYGSLPAFSVSDDLNNAALVPEQTTSYEVGIDLRFFTGRLGLDVTYYDNVTTDQILDLSVPAVSGYSRAFVNAGKLTNKGWEVMVNATILKMPSSFRWDMNFNWAMNDNMVVELAEGLDNYQLASWGPSVNARVGEPYGTIVADGYTYHENGQKLVDEDGFYVRETNKVIGSVLADYTGGISNTFSFKGITLSGLIDFQKGGTVYSTTNRYGTYSGLFAITAGNNDRGTPQRDPVEDNGGFRADGVFEDGTPNDIYLESQSYWKALRNIREEFAYDASFVKLREVRLSFAIPSKWVDKTPFRTINASLVGRNLAILHKNIPNLDPEAGLGSGNIQGFENGQHPSVRSYGFNLNFKL